MELTLKDIMCFYGCSKSTAQERIKEIKKFYEIIRKGRILKIHLANYERISLKELDYILNGN